MINKLSFSFLMMIILSPPMGYELSAQNTNTLQVVEVKAQKFQESKIDTRNVNEKEVSDVVPNDTIPEVEESKSRGVSCEISFENCTGFLIKVFVDGKYKGTLGAYGEAIYRNLSGYKDIYCVTRSRQYEWITKGNCDGNYKFRLDRETAE